MLVSICPQHRGTQCLSYIGAGELACTVFLSLQTQGFHSSVTLRFQQLLNFHLGRPVYCFPLLFHLQCCPWEEWVSDGEEVGSDGSDRGMFMLDFHVVPLYPKENSTSPLHSEGYVKHLCVLGGKGWVVPILPLAHRVQLGDRCIHSFLPLSLTRISCLPLMGLSHLVSAVSWEPFAGLDLLFC